MSYLILSTQSESLVLHERIRQARWGFNLSVGFAGISATATLAGVILLLSGHLSQVGYATIGGLTSAAVGSRCMQLSREANDRLDRITHDPTKESAT